MLTSVLARSSFSRVWKCRRSSAAARADGELARRSTSQEVPLHPDRLGARRPRPGGAAYGALLLVQLLVQDLVQVVHDVVVPADR
jgi:hypothetical protein